MCETAHHSAGPLASHISFVAFVQFHSEAHTPLNDYFLPYISKAKAEKGHLLVLDARIFTSDSSRLTAITSVVEPFFDDDESSQSTTNECSLSMTDCFADNIRDLLDEINDLERTTQIGWRPQRLLAYRFPDDEVRIVPRQNLSASAEIKRHSITSSIQAMKLIEDGLSRIDSGILCRSDWEMFGCIFVSIASASNKLSLVCQLLFPNQRRDQEAKSACSAFLQAQNLFSCLLNRISCSPSNQTQSCPLVDLIFQSSPTAIAFVTAADFVWDDYKPSQQIPEVLSVSVSSLPVVCEQSNHFDSASSVSETETTFTLDSSEIVDAERADFSELNSLMSNLRNEITLLNSKNSAMDQAFQKSQMNHEDELKIKDQQISRLQSELAKVQTMHDSLSILHEKTQADSLNANHQFKDILFASVQNRLNGAEQALKMDLIHENVEILGDQIQLLQKEKKFLGEKSKVLQQSAKHLGVKLFQAQNELAALRAVNVNLKSKLAEQAMKLEAEQKSVSALKGKSEQFSFVMADLQIKMNASVKHESTLQSLLDESKEETLCWKAKHEKIRLESSKIAACIQEKQEEMEAKYSAMQSSLETSHQATADAHAKYDKAKMGASEAIELVAALTVRLEETTASLETIRDEKLQLEKRLETTEQVGASKKREEELLLSEIGKTKVQFSAALEQKQQDQERLELAARETTEIQTKLSVLTDEMVSLKQHSVRNQEELRIALKETDQQKEKLRQVQSLLETLQQKNAQLLLLQEESAQASVNYRKIISDMEKVAQQKSLQNETEANEMKTHLQNGYDQMTRLQTNLEQSEQYSQEKSVRVKALHERAGKASHLIESASVRCRQLNEVLDDQINTFSTKECPNSVTLSDDPQVGSSRRVTRNSQKKPPQVPTLKNAAESPVRAPLQPANPAKRKFQHDVHDPNIESDVSSQLRDIELTMPLKRGRSKLADLKAQALADLDQLEQRRPSTMDKENRLSSESDLLVDFQPTPMAQNQTSRGHDETDARRRLFKIPSSAVSITSLAKPGRELFQTFLSGIKKQPKMKA